MTLLPNSGDLGPLSNDWRDRMEDTTEVFPTISGSDNYGPTPLAFLAIAGYRMKLRIFEGMSQPLAFAVFHAGKQELTFRKDMLLFPPQKHQMDDVLAWRTCMASSPTARFLLAWTIANHASSPVSESFLMHFVPPGHRVTQEVVVRYSRTIAAVTNLLVPTTRLRSQIKVCGLPLVFGDNKWRERLEATEPGLSDAVVRFLAVRNQCPRTIINSVLDGAVLPWYEWFGQLVEDLTFLRFLGRQASQMFQTPRKQGWYAQLML